MGEFLVFLHIFFIALLLMGVGVLDYASIKLHKTTDIKEFGVYMLMGKTAGMMTPVAAIAAGLIGIGAASQLGYSLTDGWLIAAYIGLAAALIVPPLTLKKWGQAAGKMMPQAMAAGKILPEQRELMTGKKHLAVEVFMNALLIFFFDMVFKPF